MPLPVPPCRICGGPTERVGEDDKEVAFACYRHGITIRIEKLQRPSRK